MQTLDTEIDALRELIDRSIIDLGKELGLEGEASDADPESDAADEPDAPKPVDEAEEKDRDHSEAVRLLASQLIATGHSPKEAEERLVEEFGVSDPKPALEAIGYKHKRFRRNAYVRAGD